MEQLRRFVPGLNKYLLWLTNDKNAIPPADYLTALELKFHK